jgi:class 3 adenylate cyclase
MHAQGRGARTMTAARRLAAILAVDVVGYNRLIAADEADAEAGGVQLTAETSPTPRRAPSKAG